MLYLGTLQILAKNSIRLDHLARQLQTSDFKNFDYILAMDVSHNLLLKLLGYIQYLARSLAKLDFSRTLISVILIALSLRIAPLKVRFQHCESFALPSINACC